jgi:hypothetical protein
MKGIYIITNTKNGKVYIGKTERDIWERLKMEHRADLIYNKHYNKHLQRSWNKYGENYFTFKVLEKCNDYITTKDLNKKEMYWIAYYQSNNPKFGYNKTIGGGSISKKEKNRIQIIANIKNKNITIETIIISNQNYKNKKYILGKNKKLKTKNLKRKNHYDKHIISKEIRQKISIANKGKEPWNKGKKMTDYEKECRKEKMRGRNAWNKGYTKETHQSLKQQSKTKRKILLE